MNQLHLVLVKGPIHSLVTTYSAPGSVDMNLITVGQHHIHIKHSMRRNGFQVGSTI